VRWQRSTRYCPQCGKPYIRDEILGPDGALLPCRLFVHEQRPAWWPTLGYAWLLTRACKAVAAAINPFEVTDEDIANAV